VSDGSLASAAGKNSFPPAPATDSKVALAAAQGPASEPRVLAEPRGRLPIAFPSNAALILVAGILIGLLFGTLLARQWLLTREPASNENAARPTRSQPQQAIETGAGGVSETGAAPEIRFAARRDPGETTIVLAPRPTGNEVAIEHSSDRDV